MNSRLKKTTTRRRVERAKPSVGSDGYYRIEVHPKREFIFFSMHDHDIGQNGHTMRIAGKLKNGRWGTALWLVSKKDAHVSPKGRLVIDDSATPPLLRHFRENLQHVNGDVFRAKSVLLHR